MSVAFATPDELAMTLGVDFDNDQADRADFVLRLASSAVQQEAHQQFVLVTDDAIVLAETVSSRELKLPQRPVLAVASVSVNGLNVPGYDFTPAGRIRWLGGGDFLSFPGLIFNAPYIEPEQGPIIRVVYTHGYALAAEDVPDPNPLGIEVLPDALKTIALAAAGRAISHPAVTVPRDASGADIYGDVGSFAVSHSAPVALTADERATLRGWRPRK